MNEEMKISKDAPESDSVDKENLVTLGKQVKTIYHLWLVGEIGDPSAFLKWFDILQSASDDDVVVIHINSIGGELWTAVQIVSHIKMCQAQVVCQIESLCCSAATMVALACDGMMCLPHGSMMIHTSSGVMFGKQSDIKKEEEFYNPWLDRFFNETYKHFLTKKEIENVLNGTDIWLSSSEVMERAKRRVTILNREHERAKREQMKQIQSLMSGCQLPGMADSPAEEGEKPQPKKKRGKTKKARK